MRAVTSKNIPELEPQKFAFLRELGLSDHEIQVYQVMAFEAKAMSAQDIAGKMLVFPNALYRVFKELEAIGLIRSVSKRPLRYITTQVQQGLNTAYLHRRDQLEAALRLATNSDHHTAPTQTYTVVGREQMYNEYIRLAQDAQKEISVFAIGIAYSNALHQVQEAALAKGVYIRHVVQQLQPSNYHVINKWQRMGVKMKYFKEERGFHLTFIDDSVAMITFSDPENTDDRFSIVTYQPFAVRMFKAQFEAVWRQAQAIDTYTKVE